MSNAIKNFYEDYVWLSNFWPSEVVYEDMKFPTVENAYQAAKASKENRIPFLTVLPGQAKRLGKNVKMTKERLQTWERIKDNVMLNLLEQKFTHGTPLAKKLLDTGDVDIIEGNCWGDTYWGVCDGVGLNKLGILLMNQRAYLKEIRCEKSPTGRHEHGDTQLWYWCKYCGKDLTPEIPYADAPGRGL